MSYELKRQDKYLWHLINENIDKIYPDKPQILNDRIEEEMKVITENDFTDYILIIWDILNFCRDEDRVRSFCKKQDIKEPEYGVIPIGPGRGSVGGSVVCYIIGIHEVDPILFGLHFERFLNAERIAFPDIDVDISQKYRHIVLAYMAWKYGYTAQIITYGTLSARSVLDEVLNSSNVASSHRTTLKDMMPSEPTLMIGDMEENAKFMELLSKTPFEDFAYKVDTQQKAKRIMDNEMGSVYPQYHDAIMKYALGITSQPIMVEIKNTITANKAFDIMKSLEKLSKHESTHSGGVVISPVSLDDAVPTMARKLKGNKGFGPLTTQYDMRLLEQLGFLKMDMLGLRTVDVNFDAEMLVRKYYNPDFKKSEIPYDDSKTYELFREGDTVGIFQIESSGFTQMMREISIGAEEAMERHLSEIEMMRNIDIGDFMWISAGLSMYRPGPLDAIIEGKTMVQHVIDRKHGREPVIYLFPEEEEYLSESYGVMIYQEQVMSRVRQMTGCTMGKADKFRKVMGKKDKVEMGYQLDWFEETAFNHDFTVKNLNDTAKKQLISRAKDEIEKFARYGFNKAHTVEYAHICYVNAYIKTHYPLAFYTALLNSFMDDNKRQAIIIKDMMKHDIQMFPPKINYSGQLFSIAFDNDDNDTGVAFGLEAIKGLGEKGVHHIIEERETNGKYHSVEEFRARVQGGKCNKTIMQRLAKCGAFDDLIPNSVCTLNDRATLVMTIPNISDKITKLKQKKANKGNVPRIMEEINSIKYAVERHPVDIIEYAQWEKEVLNYFISANPLDAYDDEMFRWTAIDGVEMEDLPNEFYVAGYMSAKHETIIKKEGRNKGKAMAFVTIETKTESYEATLFPDIYESCKPYMEKGREVVLKGKRNTYKGAVTIQGMYMRYLVNSGIRDCPECYIRLNSNVSLQEILKLQGMFTDHPGLTKVHLQVNVGKYDYQIGIPNTVSINDRIIDYCNSIGLLTYKPIKL